jgi:hypothetical protein
VMCSGVLRICLCLHSADAGNTAALRCWRTCSEV